MRTFAKVNKDLHSCPSSRLGPHHVIDYSGAGLQGREQRTAYPSHWSRWVMRGGGKERGLLHYAAGQFQFVPMPQIHLMSLGNTLSFSFISALCLQNGGRHIDILYRCNPITSTTKCMGNNSENAISVLNQSLFMDAACDNTQFFKISWHIILATLLFSKILTTKNSC